MEDIFLIQIFQSHGMQNLYAFDLTDITTKWLRKLRNNRTLNTKEQRIIQQLRFTNNGSVDSGHVQDI